MQLPGATVVLQWGGVVLRPVRQPAAADGSFALCVPEDAQSATVWAEFGDDSSEEAVVTFAPGEARQVHLRVLFGDTEPGRIVGRVIDGATNRPVATAAVSVAGRAQEVQTDRQGRFALAGVPAGAHQIHVRRIGYASLEYPVAVTRGLTTELEVGLVPDPTEMEPLVVTAIRPRRLEVGGSTSASTTANWSAGAPSSPWRTSTAAAPSVSRTCWPTRPASASGVPAPVFATAGSKVRGRRAASRRAAAGSGPTSTALRCPPRIWTRSCSRWRSPASRYTRALPSCRQSSAATMRVAASS